ncbi:MAG: ATP-binding cassette domain-containing protein [Rhodothermales bacterium]
MTELRVEEVSKQYGQVKAVNNVSLEARSGRVMGLLGPNGAGKTSTIRMIAYITIPDSGRVTFNGKPVGVWSQERMGYLPEERGLYKKLKVGEQLVYLAELKGLSRPEANRRVKHWLERFDALDWASKKTEELSKGMQQKMQFISTVVHEPELLILDEPFSGLDPINAGVLKEVILDMKQQGRVILFASHRMEQVEQLCDDICLISRGEIVLDGPLREVKQRFGRNRVVVEFGGEGMFVEELVQEGVISVSERTAHRVELKMLNDRHPSIVLERAMAAGEDIHRFERVEPSMNDIFVSVVEGQATARTAS